MMEASTRDTVRGLGMFWAFVALITLAIVVAVPLILHDIAIIVEFWKQ